MLTKAQLAEITELYEGAKSAPWYSYAGRLLAHIQTIKAERDRMREMLLAIVAGHEEGRNAEYIIALVTPLIQQARQALQPERKEGGE